uniref:Methyltransferase n=1 Tax=Schistocephalus solidus TaxID=70667 RepID=A0A183TEU7_SCHSO
LMYDPPSGATAAANDGIVRKGGRLAVCAPSFVGDLTHVAGVRSACHFSIISEYGRKKRSSRRDWLPTISARAASHQRGRRSRTVAGPRPSPACLCSVAIRRERYPGSQMPFQYMAIGIAQDFRGQYGLLGRFLEKNDFFAIHANRAAIAAEAI